MVSDLQTPYRNAAIELPINGQVANSSAVVAALGLFQQAYQLHRLNLRRTGKRPHIHRRKIRAQCVEVLCERALDIADKMLDRGVFFDGQQLRNDPAARLSHSRNIVPGQIN